MKASTVRLPKGLVREADREAKAAGVSRAELVRRSLRRHFTGTKLSRR